MMEAPILRGWFRGHTSQICSWDGGTFSDAKFFVDQGGPMLSMFSRKAEVTFHCLVSLDITSYVNSLYSCIAWQPDKHLWELLHQIGFLTLALALLLLDREGF